MTEGEGVTLFLDLNNDGFVWDSPDDLTIIFIPNGKWKVIAGGALEAEEKDVSFAVNTSRGGYTEEIAVSWELLGITPVKGKVIGFSAAIRDLDMSPKFKQSGLNWMYKAVSGPVKLGTMQIQ